MVTWLHLYQWGDGIDVRGDGRAKRLGTPALNTSNVLTEQPSGGGYSKLSFFALTSASFSVK